MRYFGYIQKIVIGSIFGAFVLVGTAGAQEVNREYQRLADGSAAG